MFRTRHRFVMIIWWRWWISLFASRSIKTTFFQDLLDKLNLESSLLTWHWQLKHFYVCGLTRRVKSTHSTTEVITLHKRIQTRKSSTFHKNTQTRMRWRRQCQTAKVKSLRKKLSSSYSKIIQLSFLVSKLDFRDLKLKIH